MANAQGFVPCSETHPSLGVACSRDTAHVQHEDAQVKQHVAANGVKWPSLHELNPHEGYNDFVTFRL